MRPTTFKVDNTVYWTIRTYTDAGVLVDADSTPSVAVRKNGASVADSVTVTKRAATTGIYDCSYNPAGEAEGDCFTIEETATISSQAYENAWSIEAQAEERGTDNAASQTSVDSIDTDVQDIGSDVSAILTDTDELQGNQGDWATATGFSTHSADDVAAVILDDPNNLLVTDGSGQVAASNMRGTDNALLASSAPTNWSDLDIEVTTGKVTTANPASGSGSSHTAADVAALILDDPSNLLVTNASGQVETSNASGGGASAADIYTYFTDANREDAFKADVPTEAEIYTYFTASTRPNVFKADVSGLSTLDTSDIATGCTNALNSYDAAKETELESEIQSVLTAIGNLNNFDPANDAVANVTLVDTTTDVTNAGGGGSSAADIYTYFTDGAREDAFKATGFSTFDPASDVVARVTLVDTTTDLTNQTAGGVGMFQASIRVQDSNGAALQGARINVDGTTLSLTTGVSGEVVFNLDSGVYLLNVLPPADYDTPAGQVLTVASSDPSQTVFNLTSTSPPSGACNIPWLG